MLLYKASDIMTCYIVNKITNEKIIFPVYPDDVSETYSGSWESTDIRGRSAPYYGFSGNEARSLSYSISLSDDLCEEHGYDLDKITKQCKALVYPLYKGSIVIPPFCQVKLGSLISMKGIIQNVSVTWSGPVLSGKKRYSQAEVSIDFTELRTGKIPTAKSF